MNKNILIILAITFSVFEYGVAQSTHLYEIGTKDSLYSNTLEEQRVIWVQLPENYNQESKQLYPVIYVLDGAVHLQAVSTVLSYNWGGFMP